MNAMNEKQLQYIWQQRLFDNSNLFTTKGEKVEIIDVGLLNNDAGADMFNAKIRIGTTLWAIVSHFSSLNFKITSAYDSQAIIQLKQHYCDRKDCLRCRFAYEIFSKNN